MKKKDQLVLALVILAAPALRANANTTEPPEYYCHDVKQDRYIFADPDQRDECKDMQGQFGIFSRKQRKYFCRLTDSGFYLGKSYTRRQADAKCSEAGGTLQ